MVNVNLKIPKQICWCCQQEVEHSNIVLPIMLCLKCFAALRMVVQKEKARLSINLKDPKTEAETRTIINAYENGKESDLPIGFKVLNKQEGPYLIKKMFRRKSNE